ncbi:hypothetical protein [Pelosinus sp. sgz500959]|uniref:hypothetical protein n=1 Tax=Pelosinus sp. sgz500959 TaxID=3242472 RepID=UPI00366C5F96
MKKTLIPGMFSSISDAELVTEMLNTTNEEDIKPKDGIKPEEGKKNNWLPNL